MNQGFSPVLAQLLMAGLDRRALVRAAFRLDQRPGRDRWEALAERSYTADALDWGIAAFLSGRTRSLADAEAR